MPRCTATGPRRTCGRSSSRSAGRGPPGRKRACCRRCAPSRGSGGCSPPPRLAGRAARGGAILMAVRLLVQLFVWGVTLLVARLLTPFDYGLMTTGMVFLGLADLLAEAGVGRALVQKEDLQPADVTGAF